MVIGILKIAGAFLHIIPVLGPLVGGTVQVVAGGAQLIVHGLVG